MQKKSPRGIPDFSRKATAPRDVGAHGSTPDAKRDAGAQRTPKPAPKPQNTNAKSGGRRGA
jgi:hypothetical protein